MEFLRHPPDLVIDPSEQILITGSAGFIGSPVVATLLEHGFRNLRCLIRPSSSIGRLQAVAARHRATSVDLLEGNLLSPQLCERAVAGVSVIFHLAAGVEKSFPSAYMNSVVATRNLLEAAVKEGRLRRLVNVSSFAVYSTRRIERGGLLTEDTPLEEDAVARGEAYAYGKLKQDELVAEYVQRFQLPVTTVRPGAVFGPGRTGITGRVGIDTFGLYLHLGGSNLVPFTYVDNCADAIVLAGLIKGAEGHIFNVVDDDLPTSRQFLRLYKKNVKDFRSVDVPYPLCLLLCLAWEKYSGWSKGQLPPVFNRNRARAEWKGNTFSNRKLKEMLGWCPRVGMSDALARYFSYQRETGRC